LPLKIDLRGTPANYFERLDRKTQKRITERLNKIADSPFSAELSKPLSGRGERTTRVGNYRVLFVLVGEDTLRVVDIGPRGDIYK
jgi:mRNA-degrading endonuclease RelE of RelBE toxin-antitoxin system